MSPLASIETALRTEALATSLTQEDVQVPNIKFDPTGKDLWVEFIFIPAQVEADTLGEGGNDLYQGIFQININVPIDSGRGSADTLGEELRNRFPAGKVIGSPRVQIRSFSPGTPERNSQTFYTYPFSVTWQSRVARPPITN